jgi:hypothetical protein
MQAHSLLSALGQPRSGEQFVTTTISTDEDIATLINVFTVEPDRQQQLIGLPTRPPPRSSGIVKASPQTSTRAPPALEW